MRLPRARSDDHIYLTHDEVAMLAGSAIDVTGNETDRTLINFLAYMGLRINEALALQVKAIDLDTARIVVKSTWSLDGSGARVLTSTKTGKTRSVGIPAFLVDELRGLVAGLGPDDFVFQAARGGPMNDHNWRTRVFDLCKREAGLDDIGLTPHKLRHTAASMAIAAGADVKLVQQMLGHADASETLNTYAHLWPDRIHEIASALDDARNHALSKPSGTNVPTMSPRTDPGQQKRAAYPGFPR